MPNRFGWCAAESGNGADFDFRELYDAWRQCRRRGTEVALRRDEAGLLPDSSVPAIRIDIDWILFPVGFLRTLRRRLRIAGVEHLFVAEEGWLRGGLKRRVFRLYWRTLSTGAVKRGFGNGRMVTQ